MKGHTYSKRRRPAYNRGDQRTGDVVHELLALFNASKGHRLSSHLESRRMARVLFNRSMRVQMRLIALNAAAREAQGAA